MVMPILLPERTFLYFAKEVFEMQEANFYQEHPEREGWWLNELDTLGIDTENNNNNELSDKQENSNLVETIKQTLLEDYKQTSSTNY